MLSKRLLSRCLLIRSYSTIPQNLNQIYEFAQAEKYYQLGKYRIAEEFLLRAKSMLENQRDQEEEMVVLRKQQIRTKLQLREYDEVEDLLEEVVERVQKLRGLHHPQVYQEYHNLFVHCLSHHLSKAILLGKALDTDKEKQQFIFYIHREISPAMRTQFALNLGTAYLLDGQLVHAKYKLRECLQLSPCDRVVRGQALNNLGVACWWHKYPNFREFPDSESEEEEPRLMLIKQQQLLEEVQIETEAAYTYEDLEHDFEQTIPLFKEALQNLQSDLPYPAQQARLNTLLDPTLIIPTDFQSYDPGAELLLTDKCCGKTILNIGEFLFSIKNQHEDEARFWFKYALTFFQKYDLQMIDRSLITLALLCSQQGKFGKAEGLFQQCLQLLQKSHSYNLVLCMQLYGKMLKKLPHRTRESEKLMKESYQVANRLPSHSNKLIHVHIPALLP